jgi:hypothetical protein
MNPSKVRRDLIIVFINLMTEGIRLGRTDLASKVLDALRLFRPGLTVQLFQFSVWILICRGEYMEAIRELNSQDASMPQWNAMMCLCLAATGDPTWNIHADLVQEGDDEISKTLVQALRDPDLASSPVLPTTVGMPVDLNPSLGRV